jgi:DNA-directed RNA polymerase subunit L
MSATTTTTTKTTKSRPVFQNYAESGPALLGEPGTHITGTFVLRQTNTTIANTLRRCILSETRSVGFRADLTNTANPGVVIRKNTSVIFNEMLAHRLTLIPLAVRRIDDFDVSKYQCTLTVKNDRRGAATADTLHVTAADFRILKDGVDEGTPAASALFPVDPITGDASLIVTLRPQWNTEQPPEEVDLTATPIVGRGRDHVGFCPVSQCSYGNTLDPDPVRQEDFFKEWLGAFKKVADPAALVPEVLEKFRQEWRTLAVQRCFLVDEEGEANSFDFTIESVGVRPVPDIVAEGIRAVIALVAPYADTSKSLEDLAITVQPADSRMNGIDMVFEGQEHTLGNLLQSLITEMYLDGGGAVTGPIVFAGYKVRHPLRRAMTLRLGFRDGVTVDGREIVATAAGAAVSLFEDMARSWSLVSGSGAAGGVAGARSAAATAIDLEG